MLRQGRLFASNMHVLHTRSNARISYERCTDWCNDRGAPRLKKNKSTKFQTPMGPLTRRTRPASPDADTQEASGCVDAHIYGCASAFKKIGRGRVRDPELH
jgi:hypothetical protein